MRTPHKKPRGDSKLDRLPEDQKEQLCAWLTVENLTYKEARTRCAEQFGCFTTEHALSQFFQSVALRWKYAQDHSAAQEMASWQQGDFQPAVKKRLEQLAFQLASSPTVDVKTLKSFIKMLTDGEKVQLQKNTLSLALDKFRQSVKSEQDKGLDALYEEIKHLPEAVELFTRMRAIVTSAVEAAK
jgi:glutamine synthetase type III